MVNRKTTKRILPVTHSSTPSAHSASRETTRSVIRAFHVLLKRKAKLDPHQNTSELHEIDRAIDDLGGLSRYQQFSRVGQDVNRGGGSESVFIEWLLEAGLHRQSSQQKYQLLEVGALKSDNYISCSTWLQVSPIDLSPLAQGIQKQDFFELDRPSNKEKWNAISLSLVLNFVPTAVDRGRMLSICHEFLRSDGLLFIVLPSQCMLNSRYMDLHNFRFLMEQLGYNLKFQKLKPGGKVAYWLFQKMSRPSSSLLAVKQRKEVIRTGSQRNNFYITAPLETERI